MNNERRKCFTFFVSFYYAISSLPDERDQLNLYKAIAEYALFDAEPQLEGICSAMFDLMRPNIDSSNARRKTAKKVARRKVIRMQPKGLDILTTKIQAKNKLTTTKIQAKNNPI